MNEEKHIHEWRVFERDDDAVPLWTDCLTCNARKVKDTLRGTYTKYQWNLPKEERDHGKQVIYY